MFNSVLSSVGLSVGAAATTDTTSFLSNTVTTATDAKTIVIILFLGVLVDQLAIYHYAPEEWLLAELCYDAADFAADCGNCAEYD